jgi:site-specific recombinase XerC
MGAAMAEAGLNWQIAPSGWLRDWIYALPFVAETKVGYLKAVRGFYEFAVGEGWVGANPALAVKRPKIVRGEVGFLRVDEAEALFAKAWERDREICGNMALGAFGGMRSSAIVRLNPKKDLDWRQRGILMPARSTKASKRFFVQHFPANLWDWLTACPPVALGQRQWDDRRAAVAAWANVELPHNALRHSFCSYHVALHGNAERTATLLTQKGTDQLWEHYKGNATRADAKRYFWIIPR